MLVKQCKTRLLYNLKCNTVLLFIKLANSEGYCLGKNCGTCFNSKPMIKTTTMHYINVTVSVKTLHVQMEILVYFSMFKIS